MFAPNLNNYNIDIKDETVLTKPVSVYASIVVTFTFCVRVSISYLRIWTLNEWCQVSISFMENENNLVINNRKHQSV